MGRMYIRKGRRRRPSASGTDWWPRIAIISSVISSVVIAAISLITSASLQRTQMTLTKQTADAQIDMSRRKAEDDKRLQEGQLTAQFVQHLIGKDVTQREIAIISLRAAIPPDISDNILGVVARKDPDSNVRAFAIEQLAKSTSARAAATLNDIAHDVVRSETERDLATASNLEVTVRQAVARTAADQNTFMLAATNSLSVMRDSGEFTHAIVRGLNGAADEDHNGQVSGSELGRYVASTVPTMASWQGFSQQPVWLSKGVSDLVLSTRAPADLARQYTGIYVLVVAPSSPEFALPIAAKDASEFAAIWNNQGARVQVLAGDAASRNRVEDVIARLSQVVRKTDLFVFCFNGPASSGADGQVRWWLSAGKESLMPSDLNRLTDHIAANNKALFMNSCYAGAVTRN